MLKHIELSRGAEEKRLLSSFPSAPLLETCILKPMSDQDKTVSKTRDERQAHVEQVVGGVAGEPVIVSFSPGRRETDIIGVTLTGEKEAVLALPLDILERLPEEDVEVIGSEGEGSDYALELVITKRLEAQEISTPERRSKLQNFLFQEMAGQKE